MPEIAVMREGQWWLRTGDDAEQPRTLGHWPADRAWVDLLRADVNGDGLDDLIGRDAADGRWWASRSTGWEFDTGIVGAWSNSVDWEDVHAADVNGDGLRDVVGRADGRWWVALSDGERLVNRRWGSWSSSADWHHVRVADVNGDGLDDVVGLANDKWWVAVSDGTRFHNTVWGAGPWAANSVDVLNRARQLADQAIDQLLAGGLFRAATGAGHYESANGPGSLAMELFRLHLTLTDSDYSLPRNYWDV